MAYHEDGTESGERVQEIESNEVIFSGTEYRAYLKIYSDLLDSNPAPALLTREQYNSTEFKTVNDQPIAKTPLAASTFLVSVRPQSQRFSDQSEQLKLAEFLIDIRIAIAANVMTLLLDQFTKGVIYTSENNIGYRV